MNWLINIFFTGLWTGIKAFFGGLFRTTPQDKLDKINETTLKDVQDAKQIQDTVSRSPDGDSNRWLHEHNTY